MITNPHPAASTVVVPHATMTIQLLRKFLRLTQPLIDQQYGGTMPKSMWSYLFGNSKNKNRHEQVTFHPFKTLVQILLSHDDDDDDENHPAEDDDEVAPPPGDESESSMYMNHPMNVVTTTDHADAGIDDDNNNHSNNGHDTDPAVQEQCRAALSTFIDLFAVWGHASSSWFLDATSAAASGSSSSAARKGHSNSKQQNTYVTLQVTILNTACQLITHGCLDEVYICMIQNHNNNTPSKTTATEDPSDNDRDSSTPTEAVVSSASTLTTTTTTSTNAPIMAAQILASSVFNSDLTHVRAELVAMKFLLCTGCRRTTTSLLRGSYLLQSIRTLYHIYLTTESAANKVTARAALQQLVTNVFTKVVQEQSPPPLPNHHNVPALSDAATVTATTDAMNTSNGSISTDANTAAFPSENHRDAFLVLRSICKLSMRSLPDDMPNHNNLPLPANHQQPLQQHSHYGIQTSASHDMWDGDNRLATPRPNNNNSFSERNGMYNDSQHSALSTSQQSTKKQRVSLVYTGAIHPALESKILALELLLYLLQHVDYTSNDFIHHCGTQFHVAIKNYLCVSLLKNCTSNNTHIVSLSLRIFVPVVQNFRTVLKNEIEAFVTNVFFVILQSKNSPAEHKSIVVNTFNEICSDPSTLAEIFLNYDCDLSAVDLFHRIVNTLSRLSREGLHQDSSHGSSGITTGGMTSFLLGGPTEAQMEKQRNESRNLRLDAMRALRQILASLHASIVEPMNNTGSNDTTGANATTAETVNDNVSVDTNFSNGSTDIKTHQQTLVDIYGSKKKRRAEEQEAILRFNQKPSAGIAYAAKCQHIDPDDPVDVARYLLKNKDEFDKAMIGEYLGREKEYQNGFSIRVLHEYVRLMDFTDLVFDDAIRYFLSGFRLPGEAQKVSQQVDCQRIVLRPTGNGFVLTMHRFNMFSYKIDRIMEKFAERFTEQNPKVFPTADAAFILSFSIIMLNTDLHNPAIKEDRRMTKEGFIRNNQGICDGQDLPDAMLISIFDRIKQNPISLKEDDEARERAGDAKKKSLSGLPAALNPASFFSSHYSDADRARESNFQKERDHIVRTTESLLKRRRHGTEQKSQAKFRTAKSHRHSSRFVLSGDSGLRDEYVSPMFEVTWGPALAAFSTAMESANGTAGTLISIASDDELERAAENAAETIEVCLTGFRLAIGTAALCGNFIARDAYMLALSRFTQLGTGILLEPRHIRCIQTMFSIAKEDGELLSTSWEHVFKALSEVNRFHQVFQLMARNDRTAAQAAERRLRRLEAMEQKRLARSQRKAAAEDGESIGEANAYDDSESDDNDSLDDSGLFSDEREFDLEENMDAKAIDEANAREVYDAVSETTIEAIYERSSSLSATAVIEFVLQLCLVSRAEISVGTNSRPGDLNQVTYRQKHSRLSGDQFHHTQPNIYNLQKLVEVTHYNMESRPRLLFADIWVTVADHLTNTALHSNPAVAMYAVDSFRQLSIQYLKRDELEVFEFQRRFLKPLETVMALSTQTTTKELLLNCVSRLMHVFGTSNKSSDPTSSPKGGLRSGWVPILTILGIGGCDTDDGIAQTSFKALSDEIKLCLNENTHSGVLLTEYFVETVNALLMMNGSPHSEISILAVDYLVLLSDALAKGTISPVHAKRKHQSSTNITFETKKDDETMQSLELWWPILLGLSTSVGDVRLEVRSKSLEVLFELINNHFFPSDPINKATSTWETIQLIFRGILNSIIEFGESATHDGPTASLPTDFDRINNISNDDKVLQASSNDDSRNLSWLETTFDPFMDACMTLCLRSLKDDTESVLVEEIFALLNSCLLSDSGALVVRGIQRLEQFVTSDLNPTTLSDDVWATVSHMLQRCLVVRGLPKKHVPAEGASDEQVKEMEMEYAESIREFITEDGFLLNRRFIGIVATTTIGSLLCSERFSIGLRWRLFLIKWLYRGIREWDSAAEILLSDTKLQPTLTSHPHMYV